MELQITARHSHLSKQFQGTIREKVDALKLFGAPIHSVRVILGAEGKETSTVEIVINVLHQILSSRAKAENMGKALDAALAKAERQLKKLNQKKKSRVKKGFRTGMPAAETAPEEE
jgi:ribosomal subunit interface protein